jgi:phospholipase A1
MRVNQSFLVVLVGALLGAGLTEGRAETAPAADRKDPMPEATHEKTVPAPPSPKPSSETPLDERLRYERYNRSNPFVLRMHRANYILPGAYNFKRNRLTYDSGVDRGEAQQTEVKFQLSFKVNLINELIKNKVDLYAAYTQLSFWQAYNTKLSSPFRETNYEPEAGLTVYNNWRFLGFRNRVVTFAVSHQSNGRSDLASRSWNRLIGEMVLERRNFYLVLRPWYRLPEPDDDNPDILRYMGDGEVYLNYVAKKHLLSVMLRKTRAIHRGAVQADWVFPIVPAVRGYLQYFYGHGESLIDYNRINHRIGLGASISSGL